MAKRRIPKDNNQIKQEATEQTEAGCSKKEERKKLVDGFRKWTFGPNKENEVLTDLPTLVYLTGMLSPDQTRVEEDQKESEEPGPDEDNGGLEGIPNLVNAQKPSAAGFSFFVKNGVQKIHLQATFGMYLPRNHPLDSLFSGPPNSQPGSGGGSGDEGGSGDDGLANAQHSYPRCKPRWHRFSVKWSKEVSVDESPAEHLPIGGPGLSVDFPEVPAPAWTEGERNELKLIISAIYIDIRRVRLGSHSTQMTVTVVNKNKIDEQSKSLWFCPSNNDLPSKDQVNLGLMGRVQKATLFQVRIEASGVEDNPRPFVQSLIRNIPKSDPDVFQNMLIYRNQREIAIGHGCGTGWSNPDESGRAFGRVETDFIPSHEVLGLKYSIHDFEPMILNKNTEDKETIDVQGQVSAAVAGAMGWGAGGGDLRELFRIERLSGVEAIPICKALCDAYSKWLEIKELEVPHAVAGVATWMDEYHERVKEEADSNIARCREVLARMRRGIETLESNHIAMEAFRLANRAMHMQAARGFAIDDRRQEPTWRPFQLAFLLLSINSIAKPRLTLDGVEGVLEEEKIIPERDLVDLIWFPTGGGKTEAYLGLMAFCLLHRRLRFPKNPDNGAGVCVITRYTLRLLTSQQFERATRLICALELIRRADRSQLGCIPFKIGMYVGGASTPNRFKDIGSTTDPRTYVPGAYSVIESVFTKDVCPKGSDIRHLRRCPWCGAKWAEQETTTNPQPRDHYVVVDQNGNQVRRLNDANARCSLQFRCTNNSLIVDGENPIHCPFNNHRQQGIPVGEVGIPAVIVDEQIYRDAPSVIIGTVDKFAQITWKDETGILFGKSGGRQQHPAPDLIIQDELHLISGPLGSMVGIYEAAIDKLCSSPGDDNQPVMRPKIIGSTATIRQADRQVCALYDRKVRQFPPPVLTAGDSFFATTDQSKPGRLYLGIMAAGQSGKSTFMKTAAPLLELQKSLEPRCRDDYYTLIAYFNSIRELSGANPVCVDDLPPHMETLGNNRFRILDVARKSERETIQPRELTSRLNAGQVSQILGDLGLREDSNNANKIRVLLCTNMISVGVDVPRLGLMLIHGMPKSVSEYIQATSRVGREGPGLVVTIHGWTKSRDRSYYEKFKQFHQSFYREVEPTSVTCWTSRVRDRAMAAVMVAMMRHNLEAWGGDSPGDWPDDNFPHDYARFLLDRIVRNDEREEVASNEFLGELEATYRDWRFMHPDGKYGNGFRWDRRRDRLLRTPQSPREILDGLFPAAMSLRDVEQETGFKISEILGTHWPAKRDQEANPDQENS